jgi:ElaB/YqjD/DUF883 family membrane-anchored ribosome-binding protein
MDPVTSSAALPDETRRAARRRKGSVRRAARRVAPTAIADPLMSIDVELLEDLRDAAARKMRALVRDKPLSTVGGAFAAGFLVGGGWRTRLGRAILVAANRYLIFRAAKRYLTDSR